MERGQRRTKPDSLKTVGKDKDKAVTQLFQNYLIVKTLNNKKPTSWTVYVFRYLYIFVVTKILKLLHMYKSRINEISV